VCSPFNSATTNRIVNQYKRYRHTKLLLIDIIGTVFSYEHPFYGELNATLDDSLSENLLVLTILTQKFKYILKSEYHVEFSRYLNFKGTHNDTNANNVSSCLTSNKEIHYDNLTSCEREIKARCHNSTNDDVIKTFCINITLELQHWRWHGVQLNDSTFNKQLVFSEHFNLFDFITSSMKNVTNHHRHVPMQHHQSDFIVLDFKSIFNNSSVVSWRPVMILEQSRLDGHAFTMHHANLSATYEIDINIAVGWQWFKDKCGRVCYAIIAAIFLIIIGLMFIISVMVGIAAR
jgi:hypothetical protein